MARQRWQDRLETLLTTGAGARMVAYHPTAADQVVYTAALAEDFAYSGDLDTPDGLLWLRPLDAVTDTGVDTYENRIRAVATMGAAIDPDTPGQPVVFDHHGQKILVQPADEQASWTISLWQNWLDSLPADEQARIRDISQQV